MDNTDSEPDIIKSLKAQVDELLQKKQEVYLEIMELERKISLKAKRRESLERSLRESRRIAAAIKEKAQLSAASILAEAEAIVAVKEEKISLLNREIALLQAELEEGNKDEAIPFAAPVPPADKPDGSVLLAPEFGPVEADGINGDNSVYSMRLVGFVNARHFVVFGGKAGPIHAHSWQVQTEVEVPRETGDTIEFTRVSRVVAAALNPYENVILNQAHPFDIIQPTTENIAMYFYNRVDECLAELGLKLHKLNLWETPTRGI